MSLFIYLFGAAFITLEQRHRADHTFTAGFGFEIISVMVCTPLSRKLGLIFNCGLTSEEGVKRQERRRSSALCSREANQKSFFFLPDSPFFPSAISTSGTALKDVTLLRLHMWTVSILFSDLTSGRSGGTVDRQTGSWCSSGSVLLCQNIVSLLA